MIIREFFRKRKDGVDLHRSVSDRGLVIIRNDEVEYEEAIDVEDAPYTYTESDKPIENTEEP